MMQDEDSNILEYLVTLMLSDLMGYTLKPSELNDSTSMTQWSNQLETLEREKYQRYSIGRTGRNG